MNTLISVNTLLHTHPLEVPPLWIFTHSMSSQAHACPSAWGALVTVVTESPALTAALSSQAKCIQLTNGVTYSGTFSITYGPMAIYAKAGDPAIIDTVYTSADAILANVVVQRRALPPLPSPPPPSPAPPLPQHASRVLQQATCLNTCPAQPSYASDDVCDDGGPVT